ncbi:MAG TPA: thioredoxin domain-containing protein [Ruminiclostridium sp.]|nr:thioredoxin domain-containing protein [Ruminiclostridium sp.]
MIEYEHTNKLIMEKSPYLLQHAHNPVDWYPWGKEAFLKAKVEDKPIFLSIGYSTCHWCHVMERESFENADVAKLLNQSFIAIKVDREERPDVDHIYMEVCQALTGSGGWPLTIFMTHDQKPFFAGTYFPKNDRMGMKGLISILEAIGEAWKTKRDVLLNSSRQILNYISRNRVQSHEEIPDDIFDTAFSTFNQYFDPIYGGFGRAPKFPTPHNLMFLLRYWKQSGEHLALEMVEKTLDSMYKGGIYDHIGFGFCRYSTDKKWLVPHFEKMLYDNALLAMSYLEACLATRKERFGSIARDILTYILRDMTSPEGGFYCAEDADSEGVEGKFYLWSLAEVLDTLGQEEGRGFAAFYDITSKGNFEGKSIPNLINNNLPDENIGSVKASRDKLFEYRQKRIHPYKDEKILTSWNGLMIAAMSMAGRVLGDARFTDAAKKAVDFIYSRLFREDGRLLARYRDGEANYPAYAGDYAFLAWGIIELYETTYEADYLKKALELTDDLLSHFWDEEHGGVYVYGKDGESLITRPKEIYDGAMPSSNSVAAMNLLRLSRLTGRSELEERADRLLKAFSGDIVSSPMSYSYALMALMFAGAKSQGVVIVAESAEEAKPFVKSVHDAFRPFTTSLVYQPGNKELIELAPFVQPYTKLEGKASAYVCEGFNCKAPVTDTVSFENLLH